MATQLLQAESVHFSAVLVMVSDQGKSHARFTGLLVLFAK
jgi:hypothetical protein